MAKINFTKIAKEVIETEIQSLKKLKKILKIHLIKQFRQYQIVKKAK